VGTQLPKDFFSRIEFLNSKSLVPIAKAASYRKKIVDRTRALKGELYSPGALYLQEAKSLNFYSQTTNKLTEYSLVEPIKTLGGKWEQASGFLACFDQDSLPVIGDELCVPRSTLIGEEQSVLLWDYLAKYVADENAKVVGRIFKIYDHKSNQYFEFVDQKSRVYNCPLSWIGETKNIEKSETLVVAGIAEWMKIEKP